MEKDLVLIFHSVHRVMRAERLLKESGIAVRLMPVPRKLSSDCGLSLFAHSADRERIQGVLDAGGCTPEELYEAVGGDFRGLL